MALNKKRSSSMVAGLANIDPEMAKPVVEKVEAPEPEPTQEDPIITAPVEKNVGGRPRKYKPEDGAKVVSVKLKSDEIAFLEEYGGKFGGKTGYITYLVRQEMDRKFDQVLMRHGLDN